MGNLAREGSQRMEIRGRALQLVKGLQQKDFLGEARRCLEYCRDKIRYVRDIDGIETLHDAVTVDEQAAGDCDDKCILLGALLLSIGHPVRFVAVAFAPDDYSHVWTQDYMPAGYGPQRRAGWIDLEPTEPIPFGDRIPRAGAVAYLTQDA